MSYNEYLKVRESILASIKGIDRELGTDELYYNVSDDLAKHIRDAAQSLASAETESRYRL